MKRTRRSPIPPEATRFAECARRYCDLIGEHQETPVRRLLAESHRLLAELYWLALRLPNLDPGDAWPVDRMSHREWARLFRALSRRLGTRNHYVEVYDAYDRRGQGALVASLADDLADIVRDLRHGLDAWDAGNRAYAVFHWRYLGETHWGEHATSAIRALHSLREHHDYGPPLPMPDDKRTTPTPRTTRARKR